MLLPNALDVVNIIHPTLTAVLCYKKQ